MEPGRGSVTGRVLLEGKSVQIIDVVADPGSFFFRPALIHPHMLRHGCGFALANAGHDTRALQAWLGSFLSSVNRSSWYPCQPWPEVSRSVWPQRGSSGP
jgi:hypothetical protein